MKIDIGCCEDLCEATGFAELQCNAFDEPVIGMFLPPGWGVYSTSEQSVILEQPVDVIGSGTRTAVSVDCVGVSFYCPRHNPESRKAGVTVEEKDQTVVELPESVTEPEDLVRASVRIAQGGATKAGPETPDVDFCMASVVDDPVNPDCKLAKGIKEGVGFHCPANAGHSIILTDIDLKNHCHETKAGSTGVAAHRAEDLKHAHGAGLGLTTWVDETPGHTHLMDKVGSERTGPPITPQAVAEQVTEPRDARILSVAEVEDKIFDRMETGIEGYQASVPRDVRKWDALKGEQIGTVLRDSDGVVRIELKPGVEMGEAVEGLQRVLACVQEAEGGGRMIAVVRRDRRGGVLVELTPGIELDPELVDTMYAAWSWAHRAELQRYCQRQWEGV